jgi:hypothetical protein
MTLANEVMPAFPRISTTVVAVALGASSEIVSIRAGENMQYRRAHCLSSARKEPGDSERLVNLKPQWRRQ